MTPVESCDEAAKANVCPYYLSKKSLTHAQVICLPYTLLLDRSHKIPLKNSIVIFDEAHNILENLNSIHSSELTYKNTLSVFMQLRTYLDKYTAKMRARNSQKLRSLAEICSNFISFFKNSFKENKTSMKILPLDFFLAVKLDKFDFFPLQKFIEKSKVSKKIHFFSLRNSHSNEEANLIDVFLLFLSKSFILNEQISSLNFERNEKLIDCKLKIVRLEAFSELSSIIEESHAVALLGGTLSPLSTYEPLFTLQSIPREKFVSHSFDHILPEENLDVCTFCSEKKI